jgi:single stranded DNA-binding protein
MASSAANITVVGYVGQDPEIRKLDGGREVCTISIAVSGKTGGDEWTNWYRCSIWRENDIDFIDKYIKKGAYVAVFGELHSREYRDREGYDRTSMDVNAQRFMSLDKGDGGGRSGGDRDRGRGGDDRTRSGGGRGDTRGADRGRGGDDRGGGRGDDRGRGDTRGADRGRGGDDRGRGGDARGADRGRDTGGRGGDTGRPNAQRDADLDDEIPF